MYSMDICKTKHNPGSERNVLVKGDCTIASDEQFLYLWLLQDIRDQVTVAF